MTRKTVSFALKSKVREYNRSCDLYEYAKPTDFGPNSRPKNKNEKIFNNIFENAYMYIIHGTNTWPLKFCDVMILLNKNKLSYEFFVGQCILIYRQISKSKNFTLSYRKVSIFVGEKKNINLYLIHNLDGDELK